MERDERERRERGEREERERYWGKRESEKDVESMREARRGEQERREGGGGDCWDLCPQTPLR